jgi:SAM-dependent methyltransferase
MTKKGMDYEQWWDDYTEINHRDPGTRIRKKIIGEEISDDKYKVILDLGCGTGELLEYLSDRFPKKQLHGTDVSKKALELVEKKNVTKSTFIADLEKDKEIKGKYDAVVCSEVIEHLHNWKNALHVLKGHVNKGGKVIITTQSGKRYPHHLEIGHIQHFEPKEIGDVLRKDGFTVTVEKKFGWPFMTVKNIIVSNVLKGSAPKTGEISPLQKLVLNIFYYLYLISPFPGPQILVVAVQE